MGGQGGDPGARDWALHLIGGVGGGGHQPEGRAGKSKAGVGGPDLLFERLLP
jgi:hypothetical protein